MKGAEGTQQFSTRDLIAVPSYALAGVSPARHVPRVRRRGVQRNTPSHQTWMFEFSGGEHSHRLNEGCKPKDFTTGVAYFKENARLVSSFYATVFVPLSSSLRCFVLAPSIRSMYSPPASWSASSPPQRLCSTGATTTAATSTTSSWRRCRASLLGSGPRRQ